MELREIKTFLVAAEKMNFTKAAEQLGYSQAAVSIQIKQLEKALGTLLFDRIGKNIFLTDKGKEFLDHAKKIIQLTEDAVVHMTGNETQSGIIRIGTSSSILSTSFLKIIREFHVQYPNIRIHVSTGIREELYNAMYKNDLDLAYIIDQNLIDHQWSGTIVNKDQAAFVTSPMNPLANLQNITIEDVLDADVILTEAHVGYSYALNQLLAKDGLIITPYLEIGDTELIKKILLEGKSISYLAMFSIAEEVKTNKLVPLDLPEYEVTVYRQIFWHKNKYLTKATTDLIQLIKIIDGIEE